MDENKMDMSRRLMAFLVAGGITFTPVTAASVKHKEGTFVKYTVEDENRQYNEYVVKEGDNLSRISEKICSHFRVTISPKYWPAIAFLNDYPRVINPGDIIVFPRTFEELESLNTRLREVGWTGRYIRNNRIYKKNYKRQISRGSIGALLSDIYGGTVCVDDDFILLYLKAQGLDDKYILADEGSFNNDTLFELTEWIPTLDELREFQNNNRPKVKKLK